MQTYPEMNEQIKKLLEFGGQNYESYVLQRINELEEENKKLNAQVDYLVIENSNLTEKINQLKITTEKLWQRS